MLALPVETYGRARLFLTVPACFAVPGQSIASKPVGISTQRTKKEVLDTFTAIAAGAT